MTPIHTHILSIFIRLRHAVAFVSSLCTTPGRKGAKPVLKDRLLLLSCYSLYVVYNCSTHTPFLARVQDRFGNLLAKAKGNVLVGTKNAMNVATTEKSL